MQKNLNVNTTQIELRVRELNDYGVIRGIEYNRMSYE